MKIELLGNLNWQGRAVPRGTVLEVPKDKGERLLARGIAAPAKEQAKEAEKPEKKEPEKAKEKSRKPKGPDGQGQRQEAAATPEPQAGEAAEAGTEVRGEDQRQDAAATA